MVIENTRLLFQLYLRPWSAMSEIIDKGNWFFGAALVTIVGIFFAFTISLRIFQAYEATPLLLPDLRAPQTRPVAFQPRPPAPAPDNDDEEEDVVIPRLQRRPLPVVGQAGWWLVSFKPMGQFVIAFSLAVLYVPALILLLVMTERTSSFSVAFRRDYGSLLSCTFFAWAASHLPFALLGLLAPTATIALLLYEQFVFWRVDAWCAPHGLRSQSAKRRAHGRLSLAGIAF
ncbi:MAG: hypothetical protein U0Y68_11750 [Blastocatellia bacterium]